MCQFKFQRGQTPHLAPPPSERLWQGTSAFEINPWPGRRPAHIYIHIMYRWGGGRETVYLISIETNLIDSTIFLSFVVYCPWAQNDMRLVSALRKNPCGSESANIRHPPNAAATARALVRLIQWRAEEESPRSSRGIAAASRVGPLARVIIKLRMR